VLTRLIEENNLNRVSEVRMLAELMNTFPGICSANKVTLIRRTFNSWLQCNLADITQNYVRQLCLHYPKLGTTRMLSSCKNVTKRNRMLILLIRTTEGTAVPFSHNF
jgi:hypothetical protein